MKRIPSDMIEERGTGELVSDQIADHAAQLADIAIDIKNKGAVSGQDSTQAIMDAVAVGSGRILIPDGTYLVDGLSIDSKVIISGRGKLKIKDNATNPKITINADGVVIDGIEFDGNKSSNPTSYGIATSPSLSGIKIVNCYIRDFAYYGIYVDNVSDSVFSNNTIENIGDMTNSSSQSRAGIRLFGTPTNCIVQSNTIRNVTNFGIVFSGGKGNKILQNIIDTSSFIGLGQQQCTEHSIIDNYVTNCYDNGIDAQQCDDTTIKGNQCIGNGTGGTTSRCGIFYGSDNSTEYAERFVIADNFVKGNGKYGIHLVRVKQGTVSANAINGNGEQALICTISESVAFSGNHISENGKSGLDFSSSSYITIGTNVIFKNGDKTLTTSDKSMLGSNSGIRIIGGTLRRFTITNNVVYDNAGAGICIINGTGSWVSQMIVSNNNVFDTAKGGNSADPVPNTSQKYGIYIDTDFSGAGSHLTEGLLVFANACSNNYVQDLFIGANVKEIRKRDQMGGYLSYSTVDTSYGAEWNNVDRLKLGNYNLWIDGSGRLRVKNGSPANDLDGNIVGTQA